MDRTHWLTAVFVERPGAADLDLPGALASVVAVTSLEITPSEFDWNGLANYDEDPELERTGNGIPDWVEFSFLQAALQDATLDLARHAGLVNDYLWPVWEHNLAQAADDLEGESEDVIMVTAAYLTLGDYRSVEAAESLLQKTVSGFEALPDRDAYDRSRQRFFRGTGDADNDGLSNVEEWQHAEALAAANPGESAPAMFPTLALGGSVNVENPAFPPSEGEGEGEGEEEIDCRPSYTVAVASWPYGELTGGPSPVKSGEKISLRFEEAGEALFYKWLSGAGMASGSLSRKEEFPAAGNVTIAPTAGTGTVYVKESSGDITVSGGGVNETTAPTGWRAFYGPSDATMSISATTSDPDMNVYGWAAHSSPGNGGIIAQHYGKSMTVRFGGGGALVPLQQLKTVELPELVTVTASVARGGFVSASFATYGSGIEPGAVSVQRNTSPGGAGLVVHPFGGFKVAAGTPQTRHLTGLTESTSASFTLEEDGLKELILETSDPKGGTVNVAEGETPKRRWGLNEIVEVEAVAHPGWAFVGWAGDPFNDSMAQIARANGMDPEKSTRGKLKMDKDKAKTAVFKQPKPCEGSGVPAVESVRDTDIVVSVPPFGPAMGAAAPVFEFEEDVIWKVCKCGDSWCFQIDQIFVRYNIAISSLCRSNPDEDLAGIGDSLYCIWKCYISSKPNYDYEGLGPRTCFTECARRHEEFHANHDFPMVISSAQGLLSEKLSDIELLSAACPGGASLEAAKAYYERELNEAFTLWWQALISAFTSMNYDVDNLHCTAYAVERNCMIEMFLDREVECLDCASYPRQEGNYECTIP